MGLEVLIFTGKNLINKERNTYTAKSWFLVPPGKGWHYPCKSKELLRVRISMFDYAVNAFSPFAPGSFAENALWS